MEEKEQNGQQNQKQGFQQEEKEKEGFGKHPMDNRAMDDEGGGAKLKAPPFALKAQSFPYAKTADKFYGLLEGLRTGSENNYYKLRNLVQSVPQDQLQEMGRVYQSKYNKDLLGHIYQICGRFATIYNTSGRHVLPEIGHHFSPNPLSSDARPDEKGNMKQRSPADLLPGVDVQQVRKTGNKEEKYGVRVDIDGQYGVTGQETKFVFEQEREVPKGERKFRGQYPRLVALNLTDDQNKSHFNRVSLDSGHGKRQTIVMTPWKSGTFQVQYWIWHPDGHVEVMRRSLVVKSAKKISAEALTKTDALSYQAFHKQLDDEQHEQAGSLHDDQHSIAEQAGDPFIKTDRPTPIRRNHGDSKMDEPHSNFKVHGMGENGNSVRWYIRMTYGNGKGDTIPKDLDEAGSIQISPDERPWTQVGKRDRVLWLYGSKGNTLAWKLADAKRFAVIAEEYDPSGKRTGKTAIYRQVALSADETEHLEKLEKHQQKAREFGDLIAEGKQTPVRAVLTNSERGGSTPLSLFVGPSKDDPDQLVMVDLTRGITENTFYGSSIEECFAGFDSRNTYPPGHISMQVEKNEHGIPTKSRDMVSDGVSFLEKTSSVTGWASLGLAGMGALASAFPGMQPAAPLLFAGSAALSATSGITSLMNRANKSESNPLGVAVDLAGIAAAFMNLGGAFKTMGKAAVVQPNGKLFIKLAVTAEVAEGLLITADALAQLNGILAIKTDDADRQRMLVTWVGNMLLTGAISVHSIRIGLKNRTKSPKWLSEAMDGKSDRVKKVFGELSSDDLARLGKITDANRSTSMGEKLGDRYRNVVNYYAGLIESGTMNVHGLRQRLAFLERVLQIRNELARKIPRKAFKRNRFHTANVGIVRYNLFRKPGKMKSTAAGKLKHGKRPDSPVPFLKKEKIAVSGKAGIYLKENNIELSAPGKKAKGGTPGAEIVPPSPGLTLHEKSFIGANNREVDKINVDLGKFNYDHKSSPHHSERIALEDLYHDVQEKIRIDYEQPNWLIEKDGIPDDLRGTIVMYTENHPCKDCGKMMQEEFSQVFGNNITIKVIEGVEYSH